MSACRPACGACCVAPSISASTPAHPRGKPAGVRCGHLTADERCELWERPERPAVCRELRPAPDLCGGSREEAFVLIERLERLTAPRTPASIDP
jgi:hypothetical protein